MPRLTIQSADFYLQHVVCCHGMQWRKSYNFSSWEDFEVHEKWSFSDVTMKISLLIISGISVKRSDRLLQKYQLPGTWQSPHIFTARYNSNWKITCRICFKRSRIRLIWSHHDEWDDPWKKGSPWQLLFLWLIHAASTVGALNKIKGVGSDSSTGTVFIEIKLHFRHIYIYTPVF